MPLLRRAAKECCPKCSGRMIRFSADAGCHLLRCLIGSRKRYCLQCGFKWSGPWGWGPAHPVSSREYGQIARQALAIPLCAGLFSLAWLAIKTRQASAQLQAQAYLPYHARYLQSLHAASVSHGFRFPFATAGRPRLSSGFGYRVHPILHEIRFHEGIDIPLPWGTPVFPARGGVVESAGDAGGYGLRVVIRHPDGETTIYGHLSRILVAVGDSVEANKTKIGRVGSTGLSTGPHLHFELRDSKDEPIDPTALLVP